MSTAPAGDFTCNNIQTLIRGAEDIFNPASPNPDYLADVAPIELVVKTQTARPHEIQDPLRDQTIRMVYHNKCDVVVDEDCDLSERCSIDGVEAGSNCEDFALDICKQSPGFKITEMKFRGLGNTLTYQKELQINLAAEIKAMDQIVANTAAVKINGYAGVNLNTSPYTVSGTETEVPATAWNVDIFGYLEQTKKKNKFGQMNLLLGGLMGQALWKVRMETSDPTGASAARKVGTIQYWEDMFVVEDQVGEKAAYLIDPNAIIFASKAYYTPYGAGREVITSGGKQIWTTVRSNQIPGVVYDLIMQEECVGGDIITTGKLFLKFGFHLNPNRCRQAQTGIIKLVCV